MLEPIKSKLTPLKRPGLSPAPRVPAALIVLLDISGSMATPMEKRGPSKLHIAWGAFKGVLQDKMSGWYLGILAFGVDEGNGVQWIMPPSDKVELNLLKEPAPQGATPLLPALYQAWDWLKRRAEKGRLIVISDGLPNQGGGPEEVLAEAKKHGVITDCIGIPSHEAFYYDRKFLESLAKCTGGTFREVSKAQELVSAIRQLSPVERPLLSSPR